MFKQLDFKSLTASSEGLWLSENIISIIIHFSFKQLESRKIHKVKDQDVKIV